MTITDSPGPFQSPLEVIAEFGNLVPQEQQQARTRLIEAAMNAFSSVGYEAASLRAIAENAGVGFQLIAYHFGTKESLWKEAVNLAYARYMELGRSIAFDLAGDLREQFRHHLRTLMTASVQSPKWRRIVAHEFLAQTDRYEKVIKPRLKEGFERLAEPYHDQLAQMGVVTRFSPPEANNILLMFGMAMIFIPDELAFATGIPANTFQSIDMLTDLLFSLLTRGTGMLSVAPLNEVQASPAAIARQRTDLTSTGYHWGDRYKGLAGSELARLRQLEVDNESLKKLVGELVLEKRLLENKLAGN